jgi:PAS domain S-box-containing protein
MPDMLRVLYVDDEPDLLELGKVFLEESGQMKVDIATSPQEIVGSPTLFQYDVIISDYQMPGMNGIEFLKQVRKRAGDLPFILFTGRGREVVVIEAINNGADFYLQKGGTPEAQFAELEHKVRQAFSRRKSEREIRSLFEAAPVAIGVVLDRVMQRVNSYLTVMTGYSREELEGHNTRFLYLNDEEYAAVGRMREQAYREGKADDVEVRWRRKDGTVIDVRVSAVAIDRSNPLAPMMYCTADITSMKRDHTEVLTAYEQLRAAEEELHMQYDMLAKNEQDIRESRERLQTFMDSATDAFTIWDASLNLVDLNSAALSYLPAGTRKEDVIGKNFADLVPGSDKRGEIYRYLQIIKTGVPFNGIEKIPESPYGNHWLTVRAFRVGEGLGLATTDITQIKNAEEELVTAYGQLKTTNEKLREQFEELVKSEERLKKSEAEMTGILRAAPVGIGLMSADRVFLRVNDQFCKTIGYSREEIIGRNARFLYPDDDEYARAGSFYRLRAGQGTVKATETRFIRKDGTLLDIGLYGTVIDPANPAAGNIFIALDITEEKQRRK